MARKGAVTADQDESGDSELATKYRKFCDEEAARLSGQPTLATSAEGDATRGQGGTPVVKAKPQTLAGSPSPQGPKATAASDKAAQAPVKKAEVSAKNTETQPAGVATPDAAADIQICRNAYDNVKACCSNPASCLIDYRASSIQVGGLTDYCKQMSEAGANSKRVNDAAAAVCNDRKTSCQTACDRLIQKYQTLIGNCSGCDSQGIYNDALTSLQSARIQCSQADLITDTLINQGLNGNKSGNAGDSCMSAASASPSSGSGSSGDKKAGTELTSDSSASSALCELNSSAAGCNGQGTSSKSEDSQPVAQLSAAQTTHTNFNTGDTSGVSSYPTVEGASQGGSTPASVRPIANNTGGGMMGGSGGGNGGILGGNGGGGLFGGNAKSGIADIDRGLRSGGYSTTPGEDDKPDASGGFAGYGAGRDPASAPDGKGGLDLKAYLPGGRLSADTLRAAGLQMQSLGIHPSHIDMWTRISEKIQQKCHSGELLDCN